MNYGDVNYSAAGVRGAGAILKQAEINKHTILLGGANEESVVADLRVPAEGSGYPLLVIWHGFKGFKDHSFFPYLGESLARGGVASLVCNFSHNGTDPSTPQEFSRLDLFQRNTFSKEVQDIEAVLELITSNRLPEAQRLDSSKIGLAGHSRGAVSVLRVAAESDAVSAAATLAGLAVFPPLAEQEREAWLESGIHYIENARTKQRMPLGLDLLREIEGNPDMIKLAARALDKPLLVVHGDQDETLPFSQAELISSWAQNSILKKLEGGSHTFNTVHPFEGSSEQLDSLVQSLLEFVEENL